MSHAIWTKRTFFIYFSKHHLGSQRTRFKAKKKIIFQGKYVILKIKYEFYGIKILTTGGPYLEMNQKTFNFSTTSGKSRATMFK